MDRTDRLNDSVEGTALFRQVLAFEPSTDRGDLMREVWSETPWMVNAFTGPISNWGRYREIMDWCRDSFGDEASPIHHIKGAWHSGGATVFGWTWVGFSSEEMLQQFCSRWIEGGRNRPSIDGGTADLDPSGA